MKEQKDTTLIISSCLTTAPACRVQLLHLPQLLPVGGHLIYLVTKDASETKQVKRGLPPDQCGQIPLRESGCLESELV